IRGKADAEATAIYADAYGSSAEAKELYAFTKSMDTYRKVLGAHSTLVLSSGSDLFRYLGDSAGKR
ncbi:MAG: protease modulator HflC, partial [Myxococcales bacterium]|nr:protease modulator HflC [Myxococcales bacterium]